jgi:RNAse (barnase) inhibitor barstar
MDSTNFTNSDLRGFSKMFSLPDEQLESIPTPESFTRVLDIVTKRYGLSYFDALVELCDYYGREFDSVKPLLTPKVKLRLTEEVARRGLLKDNTFLIEKLD